MKLFRSMALVRLGIACALLLSGCSLLPSISSPPKFQADALVGADTWSLTDLTLRPSLQQALYTNQVMDLFAGPARDAGADLEHLPTPSGRIVDFEKEVLPQLDGEVVVATSGPIDDPLILVLVHTSDADGTLRLLAEDAQPELTRDARGVTRITSQQQDSAVAYKNWIVYTSSADLRDQTLDRIDGKGGPSLASDARYRSVVERLSGDRLGYGYLNITPLLDLVPQDDARIADAFRGRGRMAYSFGFEPGPDAGVHVLGLRMEYIPDAPLALPPTGDGDALEAMDRLPQASMLAFAGSNVGMYSQSLASLSADQQVPPELQTFLDQLGGPYALGITTPSIQRRNVDDVAFDEALSNVLGGLFFIARVSPDADAAQLTDMVSGIAGALAADDADVGSWHSAVVLDGDWLAVNAVPPAASLDDVPQDLLASDRLYQWTRKGFGQTGTNFYLSLDALEKALGNDVLSSDDLAALGLFRSVGVASQTDSGGDTHAHMTVLIAPR